MRLAVIWRVTGVLLALFSLVMLARALTGLDRLAKSIPFYRQLLQWLGGMGIIVLAVANPPTTYQRSPSAGFRPSTQAWGAS